MMYEYALTWWPVAERLSVDLCNGRKILAQTRNTNLTLSHHHPLNNNSSRSNNTIVMMVSSKKAAFNKHCWRDVQDIGKRLKGSIIRDCWDEDVTATSVFFLVENLKHPCKMMSLLKRQVDSLSVLRKAMRLLRWWIQENGEKEWKGSATGRALGRGRSPPFSVTPSKKEFFTKQRQRSSY